MIDYMHDLSDDQVVIAERLWRWLIGMRDVNRKKGIDYLTVNRKMTAREIAAVVNRSTGSSIDDSTIRKFMYYMRTVPVIGDDGKPAPRFIASSSGGDGGYWIVDTPEEYEEAMVHMISRAAKELYAMRAPLQRARHEADPKLIDDPRVKVVNALQEQFGAVIVPV